MGIAQAIDKAREQIAGKAGKFLPDRLNVQRGSSPVNNGDGTYAETPNIIAENVPCRYYDSNGYERQVAGVTAATKLVTVDIPTNVDVAATDHLIIQERGVVPEFSLQVVAVIKGSTAMMWKVLATEG